MIHILSLPAFQTMRHSSRPGQIYLIDVDAINTGIPYADSFYVTQHWCLSRIAPGDPEFVQGAKDSSRIALISNIVYKKTVWGIVKSKNIAVQYGIKLKLMRRNPGSFCAF